MNLDSFDTLRTGSIGLVSLFHDVAMSNIFWRFIMALRHAEVTAGCGSGNYCPTDPVLREQMAVFLSKTFSLPLPDPGVP